MERDKYVRYMKDGKTERCCGTCADTSCRFTHFYQCTRKSSVQRDEKNYCNQHDPVKKKQRSDARESEWRKKWAYESAQMDKARKKDAIVPKIIQCLELSLSRVVREIARDKGTEAARILTELETTLAEAKSLFDMDDTSASVPNVSDQATASKKLP